MNVFRTIQRTIRLPTPSGFERDNNTQVATGPPSILKSPTFLSILRTVSHILSKH